MTTNCVAQSTTSVIEGPNSPNVLAQESKHWVMLVSLDGFRYDNQKKYGAKNPLAMAARAPSVGDGMIPPHPSVTAPNHCVIVAGLYPATSECRRGY